MNQANIIANIHDILLFLSRDALLRISPTCKCISGTAKQILPTYPHRIINATLSAQVKDTELTFRITSFKNNGHFQLRLYSNDSAVWENISIDDFDDNFEQRFYSFNDIRPYFPKYAHFSEAKVNIGQDMYSAYHIAIMESIAHMWADGKLALINTVSAEDDEKETQDKNTCQFSNIEILFHRIELFFGSNRRRRHSATNRKCLILNACVSTSLCLVLSSNLATECQLLSCSNLEFTYWSVYYAADVAIIENVQGHLQHMVYLVHKLALARPKIKLHFGDNKQKLIEELRDIFLDAEKTLRYELTFEVFARELHGFSSYMDEFQLENGLKEKLHLSKKLVNDMTARYTLKRFSVDIDSAQRCNLGKF